MFDSSVDRGEPFEFTVGVGQVIKGWDTGVLTMKKGEKCLLRCEPDYAYGAAGSPPKIPPHSTLEFEVELLSWQSVKDIKGDGGVVKTVVEEGSKFGPLVFVFILPLNRGSALALMKKRLSCRNALLVV